MANIDLADLQCPRPKNVAEVSRTSSKKGGEGRCMQEHDFCTRSTAVSVSVVRIQASRREQPCKWDGKIRGRALQGHLLVSL